MAMTTSNSMSVKAARRVEAELCMVRETPVRRVILRRGVRGRLGRGLHARYPSHGGHENLRPLATLPVDGGPDEHLLGDAKGDGRLTFDKLTDLYHSGTKHEEDQPAHLVIHDTDVCNTRCIKEFGNPCQNFCPANVYEMVEAQDTPSGLEIHLNPSNCVHCKTCDIMDPYEIITWVPPEGGGGPNYEGM